jgi:leukotriene-A4 hydrolase
MTPEQTASKILPYLFSQCEAAHCRAIAPLQDTPSIRTSYSANLIVDKDLVPRMSARIKGSTPYSEDANKLVHAFEMEIPIPSYLLAIVVGNLVER